jgi:hypothetical protein
VVCGKQACAARYPAKAAFISLSQATPTPKPPGASPPPFPQALCTSQSSIVEKSLADANRARYESPDGRFDADAFAGDLATGRRTIALSLAIFPGSLNALALYLFFR